MKYQQTRIVIGRESGWPLETVRLMRRAWFAAGDRLQNVSKTPAESRGLTANGSGRRRSRQVGWELEPLAPEVARHQPPWKRALLGVRIPASQPDFARATRELRLGRQSSRQARGPIRPAGLPLASLRLREVCLDVARGRSMRAKSDLLSATLPALIPDAETAYISLARHQKPPRIPGIPLVALKRCSSIRHARHRPNA